MIRSALALACLALALDAQDIALESEPVRWRLSGESFSSDVGRLGLVGLHVDVLDRVAALPGVFFGLGGYGAASGSRGGLFVGGVTAGWRHEFADDWRVEVGLFGGGGGGGGNAEFDGLFLRPFVALERRLGLFGLRVEGAHVNTPDGEIEDTHLALGLTIPAELLEARHSKRTSIIPERAVVRRTIRARAMAQRLDPSSDSRRRDGTQLDGIELLGIGVDYVLGDYFFVPVEAYGAVGGGVDGFAMGLAGLGASLPLGSERVRLELKALAGAGGGGDVDTGGGFGWRTSVGLHIQLASAWGFAVEGGWMEYPDGSFETRTLGAGIERRLTGPELALDYPRSRLLEEGLSSDDIEVGRTRVSLQHKFYSISGDARKKDGTEYESSIALLGVAIEEPITDWFALTGRAFGPWSGNIGGYAEGFFGTKFSTRPLDDWRHVVFAVGEVGAGGGGGADVGSGLLFQIGAGYRYEWSERASVSLEIAHMEADQGTFRGEAFTLGLIWNLMQPRYR
ncbi:MAG: hypothetical protein WD226_09200 [Planctomycetota bacterium]